MTWFFWCLPLVARWMIGLFFVIEGFNHLKPKNWWAYGEILGGLLLVFGIFISPAVVLLLWINNYYLLPLCKETGIKMNRLLLVNGVLFILFNPHWINSLIIYLQRSYVVDQLL